MERPAIEVIRALEDMNRTDISLATVDLDMKVASYMSKGKMVRSLSAQRPYEQGQAAAMVTMQALLGKEEYKYVEIQPVKVYPHCSLVPRSSNDSQAHFKFCFAKGACSHLNHVLTYLSS